MNRTSRRTTAAVALLFTTTVTLTGCSKGTPPTTAPTPTPTPTLTPTPTPTPTPTQTPTRSASLDPSALVIRPGSIGPARVGMTRAEWTKTGLFKAGPALCAGELIHWAADPKGHSLFVLTDAKARIVQLSVSAPGPHTAHGNIQVGSTYGDLKRAWGSLTKAVDDGFDQASVYPPGEEDGRAYIGFLLDAPAKKVVNTTKVAVIAVTGGHKPYFQYDC